MHRLFTLPYILTLLLFLSSYASSADESTSPAKPDQTNPQSTDSEELAAMKATMKTMREEMEAMRETMEKEKAKMRAERKEFLTAYKHTFSRLSKENRYKLLGLWFDPQKGLLLENKAISKEVLVQQIKEMAKQEKYSLITCFSAPEIDPDTPAPISNLSLQQIHDLVEKYGNNKVYFIYKDWIDSRMNTRKRFNLSLTILADTDIIIHYSRASSLLSSFSVLPIKPAKPILPNDIQKALLIPKNPKFIYRKICYLPDVSKLKHLFFYSAFDTNQDSLTSEIQLPITTEQISHLYQYLKYYDYKANGFILIQQGNGPQQKLVKEIEKAFPVVLSIIAG